MKVFQPLNCLTLGRPNGPAYLSGELLNTPLYAMGQLWSGVFAGVGRAAGWIYPISTLMKKNQMDIVECNVPVKSAAAFFRGTCAPDALARYYNPFGRHSANMWCLHSFTAYSLRASDTVSWARMTFDMTRFDIWHGQEWPGDISLCQMFGLAGPCPNDAYVEELVSTKTSCFRTRNLYKQNSLYELFWCFHYIFSFVLLLWVVYHHHTVTTLTVLTVYDMM